MNFDEYTFIFSLFCIEREGEKYKLLRFCQVIRPQQ
jgi:hypothetical protein